MKVLRIQWTFLCLLFFLLTPSSNSSFSSSSLLRQDDVPPDLCFDLVNHLDHRHHRHHRSHHSHTESEALSSLTPSSLTSLCPAMCSCKWKGGKKTVSCINVSLKDLPPGIESDTQVLHLNDNDFQDSLSKAIFADHGLTNLQKIYLSRCKITSVGDNVLSSLTNLVELDLSWNLLESIPTEALKSAPSLRRLSFNNNHRLKGIEEYSFPDLESLIFLDLNDCQLEVIESGSFLGLKSLQKLLLSGNKLKSIAGSVIEPLSHLQELNLHGNYWSCDCSLRDLRIQMIQKNIPLSFDPSCHFPDRIKGQLWSNLNLDEYACPPSFFPGDTFNFIRSQHQQTQSSQKYLSSSYSSSSSSSSSFSASSFPDSTDQFHFTEGDDALLECSAESVPSPSMTWWKNGQMISNLSLMSFGRQMYLIKEEIKGPQEKSSKLIIINSLPKDSGKYFCNVTNKAGSIGKNVQLEVTAKKRTTTTSTSNRDRNGSPLASLFDSMSGETLAGIIFGLLIVLLFIFLCVIFILIRYKESFDRAASPDQQEVSNDQNNFWMLLQESSSRCLFGKDFKCFSSLCSCCPSSSNPLSGPNELTTLNAASTYTTPYGSNCNGGTHAINHVNGGTLGKNSIIVRIDAPSNGQILGNGVVTSTLITGSPSSGGNFIRIV